MTALSFTRRSALRLLAAGFVLRPEIGYSLFHDADEVNDVHSAALERAQKEVEERLKKVHAREKAKFKLLVVAGETHCTCSYAEDSLFVYGRPWNLADLAEHERLQHQFQPRFTVPKPYVVAPSKILENAYKNKRTYPDQCWQFEEEYPGCAGTYFRLSPVRFNRSKTFAIAEASYRCDGGFIAASPALWKKAGAHQWEPHAFTGTPQLDALGFPGSPDEGLLARLATDEMVQDLRARSMRYRDKTS